MPTGDWYRINSNGPSVGLSGGPAGSSSLTIFVMKPWRAAASVDRPFAVAAMLPDAAERGCAACLLPESHPTMKSSNQTNFFMIHPEVSRVCGSQLADAIHRIMFPRRAGRNKPAGRRPAAGEAKVRPRIEKEE